MPFSGYQRALTMKKKKVVGVVDCVMVEEEELACSEQPLRVWPPRLLMVGSARSETMTVVFSHLFLLLVLVVIASMIRLQRSASSTLPWTTRQHVQDDPLLHCCTRRACLGCGAQEKVKKRSRQFSMHPCLTMEASHRAALSKKQKRSIAELLMSKQEEGKVWSSLLCRALDHEKTEYEQQPQQQQSLTTMMTSHGDLLCCWWMPP